MEEPAWLEKARGYIDLGMFEEAWQMIESLPAERAKSAEAQEMRIIILLDQRNFEQAFTQCRSLTLTHPQNHAGFIQGAYVLHALGKTEDAIEFLQNGPASLKDEACYFYNLACYEVSQGRREAALTWLLQSIELDPRNRSRALSDGDLKDIHPEIPLKSS